MLFDRTVSNAAILLAGFDVIPIIYKEPIRKEISTRRKVVIGVWTGILGFLSI